MAGLVASPGYSWNAQVLSRNLSVTDDKERKMTNISIPRKNLPLIIGYYDYWVKLTYLGVISAVLGIHLALGGKITYALICLMISGLCDTFDGSVARLKNRTDKEKSYGIQIDSLADIISFGILPVVIGYAAGPYSLARDYGSFGMLINSIIISMYLLAALIRLAYFNVIEMDLLSKNEKSAYYEGLPVTSVALIIPITYSICVYFHISLSTVYNFLLLILSVAFVLKIKIPKPSMRFQLFICLIGLLVIMYIFFFSGI